ncbi:MAG: Gfo/Idh/MocA family oxidoreductase [Clostridia bacterium]|nr:Gfo/Idh/MocA family oxidoreductase [Clostridia bacterium]
MGNIKAGIVGFGYMGHFHLKRATEVEGIEVVAAYDIVAEKEKEIAENGLKPCKSLEELLDISELELIIVCTPNDSHKEISVKALNAGKNVLCEKPAAMNAGEIEEILKAAEANNKFYTVHQNRRWDKDYLKVKEVLDNDLIGKFTTINSCVYGQRGVCFGWRGDPKYGGGMLYDWGVHLIDQVLQLYPESKVERVFARLESILTPAVDDFFEVKIFFDNATCANISVGTFALQPSPRWFVFGDRGTLKLDGFSEDEGGMARIKKAVEGFDSVYAKANLGPSRTMAPLAPEQIETLNLNKVEDKQYDFYKNLVKAVKGEEKPFVSHSQILRLMKILDALFQSNKEKHAVHINL